MTTDAPFKVSLEGAKISQFTTGPQVIVVSECTRTPPELHVLVFTGPNTATAVVRLTSRAELLNFIEMLGNIGDKIWPVVKQ